jgi:hypothetical protein
MNKSKTELNEVKSKEWTLGKIISRLFLYPCSILWLCYAITSGLPSAITSGLLMNILEISISIAVPVAYLISDVLIIIGKDDNKQVER